MLYPEPPVLPSLGKDHYFMFRCLSLFLVAGIAAVATSLTAATPDLSSCDEWRPASTCNYGVSSRPSSYPISFVVIHKVQGSASSAASWFQNCAAKVSAHFIFNNSTGYCYQSVREKDIGWHAGNSYYNNRSVGIEHGGFVANNDTAKVCYDESGLESRSCTIYYSVPFDRSGIRGHNEVPGATHTDPGVHWDWTYYMSAADKRVGGAIRDKYLALGGSRWIGGQPINSETATPDTVGRYNHFQFNTASIYWTPSTGAHEIHGAIRQRWESLGWENGVCGYPTTDESVTPDGVGRYNHFTGKDALGASIYWSGSTGAWEVHGLIRQKYAELGWERSSLGYPTSNEYAVPEGRRNNFQRGTITYDAASGQVTVP